MKTWLAILIGAALVTAGCATVPMDKAEFGDRIADMQIQSGAKFPTAPLYKSTRKIAESGQ